MNTAAIKILQTRISASFRFQSSLFPLAAGILYLRNTVDRKRLADSKVILARNCFAHSSYRFGDLGRILDSDNGDVYAWMHQRGYQDQLIR